MQRMPWTCSAFIIAGLSLIGVPLTSGFVSKWNLISAAIDSGWWPIAVMVLMSSLMAIVYVGKVIEMMCFKPSNQSNTSAAIEEVPLLMLIPLWSLVLISLYCGINGDFVVNIASVAAEQLLGGMK
jgi:multicomponent Na+:H+ antiporter subunit D